jgi:para-nitrobenzyl esterase
VSSLGKTCVPLALACSTGTPPVSPVPPGGEAPLAAAPPSAAAPADAVALAPLTVAVESGLVQGVAGKDGSIAVFRGIPYAAPPTGALRWRPPERPAPWSGVRSAATFSKSCVQELRRSLLPWTEEFMLRNDVDEDCLALNVWRPQAPSQAQPPLPVLVYLYGGGFNSGSGEVALYDGEALARRGIIVITLNYRVGGFGFFCHPELSAESPQHSCGNYGLLDQISALGWVQRNIAAFGGDPSNITLSGQSAGAASVHYLTQSPLAKGLFQRAIAQSGPWDRRNQSALRADEERHGAELASGLSLAALRALPAPELFAKLAASGARFRPIVDGWVVPDQLGALLARGQLHDVPLLTGLTADERSSQKSYGKLTLAEWQAFVRKDYGDSAEAVLAHYPATTDMEAGAQQKQLLRDTGLATLVDCRKERARSGKSRDFGYLFERAIPWPEHPEYQAFHSAELPYVFDNLAVLARPWQDADRALAELMSSYWINFIRQGDPNGPGLPHWPSASDQLMRLGAQPSAAPALAAAPAELLARRFPAAHTLPAKAP